jgi:MerR family transcriptional regulator, thiopeptide resistance regulator
MFDKYFTPEQMEEIKKRGEIVGAARIREVEAEWPELIALVKAEMDKGTDPADERVQQLARRWMGLVQEFTGGDPGITQSLNTMYKQETTMQVPGMDMSAMRQAMGYINKAVQAGKKPA